MHKLPSNGHADVSRGARNLNFSLCLHPCPNFVCASIESFGSSAICTGLSEPLLVDNVISTKTSYLPGFFQLFTDLTLEFFWCYNQMSHAHTSFQHDNMDV